VPEQEFCASSNGVHFRYRLSAIYETQKDAAEQVMSAVAIVCTDITAMVNAELALRKSQEERAALLVSENAARVRNFEVSRATHKQRADQNNL
jgi:hypothetical protein